MGVQRAVDMVLKIAENKGDEAIYTYGPLIHNPQTVDLLKRQGVVPIEHADEIKEGMIIIRAHGISPQEKERIQKRGIKVIDATCPKVVHVQSIIKRHAATDYTILIVGDSEHPEVEGLLGHAYGRGVVIGNATQVDELSDFEKVCVVAQTTQSKDDYSEISGRILKKFPEALVFDTICDSTEKRQAEVKGLAAEMDVVFIVGGHNSANTRRLAKISESHGRPTFHIETAEDLRKIDLSRYSRVGISAGASTPDWVIKRIVNALTNFHVQKQIAP